MKKLGLIFICLLPVLFECNIFNNSDSTAKTKTDDTLVFFSNKDQIDFPDDAATIDSIKIIQDQLLIQIHFGGGCKTHQFALYVWQGLSKSNPPQVEIFLSHDNHGDSCEAWLGQELEFDLIPVKDYFSTTYQLSGPLLLRIYEPGSLHPFLPLPVYHF